ncbi:MAG: sugar phosphate isomerase/epimerase [Phycisphaerales bacterium]|nr:MAG: sugar phosphate isomerase/epimerase [Phycisphaerales bacterium]
MKSSYELTRRDFVQAAAGLAFATAAQAGGQGNKPSPQMKPWIAACRDNLLKITGKPDCWSAMKALGVTGVEVEVDSSLVCPGLWGPDETYSLATASELNAVKNRFLKEGLVITGFLMRNRFDERLDEELKWTRKLVRAAEELDVKAIRIDVVSRRTRGDAFFAFAVKVCKQLCDIAEGTSVCYGIENHGSVTNDPEFLQKLFDAVDSPHLGLTLDTANFYWYGHPLDELYKDFERFAPKVFHTHCKSIRYPEDKKNVRRPMGWEYSKYACPIYEGDIDFHKVAAILRKVNYQGDLCLEDESIGKYPKAEQTEVLKKEIALLKNLSKMEAHYAL